MRIAVQSFGRRRKFTNRTLAIIVRKIIRQRDNIYKMSRSISERFMSGIRNTMCFRTILSQFNRGGGGHTIYTGLADLPNSHS